MTLSAPVNWRGREKKGGVAFGITNNETAPRSKTPGNGEEQDLVALLCAYLESCRAAGADPPKKGAHAPLPNPAGFCRFLGKGMDFWERLRDEDPKIYSLLCAAFEDEALNSDLSPTLLSSYLKKRLGYGEQKADESLADCGQMTLLFEHDILEDGS